MAFNGVITISREYASGGREVGRKLAAKLVVKFYDKSVSELTAVETGIKPEVIDDFQDRTPKNFDYGTYSSGKFSPINDELFAAQSKIIKKIAEHPCIIIGRCSDYILKGTPGLINIFVTAPIENRIERVTSMHHISDKEALKIIKHSDKQRAKYHEHYSNTKWGDPHSYDIVVNTGMGIDKAVEAVYAMVMAISEKFPVH